MKALLGATLHLSARKRLPAKDMDPNMSTGLSLKAKLSGSDGIAFCCSMMSGPVK